MDWENTNFFLYFITLIVNFLSFSSGISMTWIAPVLPKLESNNTTENPFGRIITPNEGSWLAGMPALGAALGPLAAGKVAEIIGRKPTLLGVACLNVVALLITVFAKNIYLFCAARFLAGVAIGCGYTVIPMFLAEISENHNRGALGCLMTIFVAAGINFSQIVGPYVSVSNFSLICMIPLILFLPTFFYFSPETPIYLASINDEERLKVSLQKLRNKNLEGVQSEMVSVLELVRHRSDETKPKLTDLFTIRSFRKGLVISLGIIILPQAVGIGPILSYTQTIFEDAKVSLSPEIAVILVGTFQLVGTIASTATVDLAGRKILLLTSTISTCLSLISLGTYFKLKSDGFDIEMISWLPIVSLVVFITVYNLGLGPVPWVVSAELFPPSVKSTAATISAVACFFVSFVVTTAFPSLSISLGMANCFFLFAGIGIGGSIFICALMPETKGKSVQEIQSLLKA